MKKFAFPLEKIRAWRHSRLDREAARLETLLARRRALASRKEQLFEQEQFWRRHVRTSTDVTGAELNAVEAFRRWAGLERARISSEERGLAVDILNQRSAVLDARRQADLLDRLRDKRLTAWRAEADRETETMVAELVAARWR